MPTHHDMKTVLLDLENLSYGNWHFYSGFVGHRYYIQPFRFADDGTGQMQIQVGDRYMLPNHLMAQEVYDLAIELARRAQESYDG
jgi:hypothetical protein